MDLAALSEVCWGGSGEEVVDDYLLLWSGRNNGLKRDGVALAVIAVYAPTSTLQSLTETTSMSEVDSVPRGDVLVICGDLNAHIGSDATTWSTGPMEGRFYKPLMRGSTAVLFS